jgi:16S rRNA (cytosine1402-N4)-methyltransferase
VSDAPPARPPAGGHVPVLLDRIRELLGPPLARDGAVLVDATLGLGGHAVALLADHPRLHLIGIDRDPQALALAAERLGPYASRVTLVPAVYDALTDVLAVRGFDSVQGVLFDLGVSSLQIDSAGRGFAYAQDAPLDMRMNPSAGQSAADVLNNYDVGALSRIFRAYGEERFARRIAAAVVRERDRAPFDRSGRLVELIRDNVPAPARRTGGNPAKRVFQALRIEVNGELEALARAVPAALAALAVGGRIAVLAYHSLEDRIVKVELAAGAADSTPAGLPIPLPDRAPVLRLLTRGAEVAQDAEIAANPRAASARLRAAERIRATRAAS